MHSIAERTDRVIEKMRNPRYRRGYIAASNRRFMAAQIRAMREARGWSQGELAKRMGKPQSVVSRLEDPTYGRMTLQTMLEIADVFDVALFARFVTVEKFARMTRDMSPKAAAPKAFAEIEHS